MARVVAIAPDLLLASRVQGSLSAAGHEVSVAASSADAETDDAELLVADLDEVDAQELVGRGVPILGFCRHTEVERRRAAEAAGVDIVVPRSRMARELPELVERLLGARP